MLNKELIDQQDYEKYLQDSLKLQPSRILILIILIGVILLFINLANFSLISYLKDLSILVLSLMIFIIGYIYDRKHNNLRNLNSRIEDNKDAKRFDKEFIFSVPVIRKYFGDELPGTLYFNNDKITFIANRIVGLKIVWFDLNKIIQGYYDYNFLPYSFNTTIEIKELNFLLRFLLMNPTKLLVIKEKRLKVKKRYVFKIPVTKSVESHIKNLPYINI